MLLGITTVFVMWGGCKMQMCHPWILEFCFSASFKRKIVAYVTETTLAGFLKNAPLQKIHGFVFSVGNEPSLSLSMLSSLITNLIDFFCYGNISRKGKKDIPIIFSKLIQNKAFCSLGIVWPSACKFVSFWILEYHFLLIRHTKSLPPECNIFLPTALENSLQVRT